MMCTKCAVSNSMKSVVVQRPTSNAGNRIKGGQWTRTMCSVLVVILCTQMSRKQLYYLDETGSSVN